MGYLSLQMGTLIFDRRRCGPHHHRPAQTRLLIRLLAEVWFPGHACHALLASLSSPFSRGKGSAASVGGHLNEMLAGKAGPFFTGLPEAKIPVDLATQGQRRARLGHFSAPLKRKSSWPVHLGPHGPTLGLESRAAWLLAVLPPSMATCLLFISLGSHKISKNKRMGSKPFRVGYLLVLIGILIWGPALRQVPPAPTRLLTRLFQEVWFPGHACHTLLASLSPPFSRGQGK